MTFVTPVRLKMQEIFARHMRVWGRTACALRLSLFFHCFSQGGTVGAVPELAVSIEIPPPPALSFNSSVADLFPETFGVEGF